MIFHINKVIQLITKTIQDETGILNASLVGLTVDNIVYLRQPLLLTFWMDMITSGEKACCIISPPILNRSLHSLMVRRSAN